MKIQKSKFKNQNLCISLTRNNFKFYASCFKFHEEGFSAIVAVLTVMGIGLIFSSAFLFSATKSIESMKNEINSAQSYYSSESGVEDAIYRIRNNKNINSENILQTGEVSATTTIVTNGNSRTISASGNKDNAIRRVQSALTLSASEVDFFYGVQVGEGGSEMGQNSRVIGNIYSNGPVTGLSGAQIDGEAIAAAGAAPEIGANWETQNADFSFGNSGGSIIATVDSSGDVGQYTSIALGSDGFARISYIDNGNKDLKFARCANADCTSSVRNAVDTAGEVYEVTSLALDANNLAHISYYHDGNDDQKFTRCTNADCTAKNTTTIESSGNVGDTSAVKIGLDGFARIAYFQDDDGDVKYARCTNEDCTNKNITTVDAGGTVGEWLSLALGSNGFARISYYDDNGDNLKFARCTNADCTAKNITTIDSDDSVGKYNSLVLDTNGFARISYYDLSNSALKFARCTNEDCTNKNITTVDAGGTVGEYTSIALGTDGFARISYYDLSNSALKFARCTDDDCATKNISTVENSASVGKYTSLTLGSDGFGRISYYDATNGDLKFARCIDADCTGNYSKADAAQSFQLSSSNTLRRVSLYIKKVGSPSDITIQVMNDKGGRPGDSSGDIVASGTLYSSMVTGNYGWVDVTMTTNPTLNAGQAYWIVANGAVDDNNYWIWGLDNTNGYAQGVGKYSADWDAGNWTNAGGDFNFRVWVGGSISSLNGVIVSGNAKANTITNSSICGNAYYQTIDSASLTFLNNPSNPTCSDPLTNGTAYPSSTDPVAQGMPISQGNINQWKTDAQGGGQIVGDYSVSNNVSLGPKEITGNLIMTSNNKTLTITGTLYAHGNIDISNGSTIRCDSAYGANSCIIVNDGWIHISNNGVFSGSGTAGSYLLMLTTLACTGVPGSGCGHHNGAIDVHNNAAGVIFYASNGMINLHNGVNITEATAYKLRLDNTAVVTYEQGLTNANFTSGPSDGWRISNWKEIP